MQTAKEKAVAAATIVRDLNSWLCATFARSGDREADLRTRCELADRMETFAAHLRRPGTGDTA